MSTAAQTTANRVNAQFSTGPKTPEGIEACKHNATKHGLTSKQIVTKGEDPDAFDALRAGLIAQYAPASEVEAMYVEQIAQNWWRLQRARRIEANMVSDFGENKIFNVPAFHNLQRHMTTVERAWNRAITDLHKLQSPRIKAAAAVHPTEQPKPATTATSEELTTDNRQLRTGSSPIGSVFANPPQPPAVLTTPDIH